MSAAVDRALAATGHGLGELGIAWGRRPDRPRPMHLTERDHRLLAFVHDFTCATSRVLKLMFWGDAESTAGRRRLRYLHNAGLLDKLRPNLGPWRGSSEWIYRLTSRGWLVLCDVGMPADGEFYTPAKLTSISYVEHDLQVVALITTIALRAAARAGRDGPLIDAAPFTMLGPRGGTVDPHRERRAVDASPAADLGERTVRLERAGRGVLKPDATLLGIDDTGQRTAVMIEFDRTARPAKQLARLRRYDHFLTAGWRESRYAALDVEPALLLVCSSSRQIPAFTAAADDEMTAWIGRPETQRSNGEHVGREQLGITSRERLLAGDWRLSQVAAFPPAIRPRPSYGRAPFEPRQTDLPLDSLFAAPSSLGAHTVAP